LGAGLTVFLDACAIIYRVEAIAPFHLRFDALLRDIAGAGEPRLAVSRLSLLECRTKPLREGDAGLLACYDRFFDSAGLTIVELSPKVIDLATQIRAHFMLRTPDAIQAASCLVLGRDTQFLTADAAFAKVAGLRLRLIDSGQSG
jgi:predicted nucleic acid-binding protein